MPRIAPALVALLALSLSACASVQRLDAANDVHALLVAIRDDDQAQFDAHVDRPALQREVEARMNTEIQKRAAKDDRVAALGALLGPSLAKFAGEALIQPSTFRAVAEYYGSTPEQKIPGPVAIAGALKPLDDGRVCATRKKNGPCLLVFTKEGEAWKLTSFEGDTSMLRLKG